jgi:hypothetical protein
MTAAGRWSFLSASHRWFPFAQARFSFPTAARAVPSVSGSETGGTMSSAQGRALAGRVPVRPFRLS